MRSSAYIVIVGAAPHPDEETFYAELLAGASLVVAADGAAEWCMRLGVRPDIAIGDFDSSAPGARERLRAAGTEVIEYPTDKDQSDLALAVAEARRRSSASIVLTAVSTGRLDHTLAGLGELAGAGPEAALREPGFSVIALIGPTARRLQGLASLGETVSLISPGGARGVATTHLQWPLTDAALEPLSSLGISNVVTGPDPEVAVAAGTVFVVTLHST